MACAHRLCGARAAAYGMPAAWTLHASSLCCCAYAACPRRARCMRQEVSKRTACTMHVGCFALLVRCMQTASMLRARCVYAARMRHVCCRYTVLVCAVMAIIVMDVIIDTCQGVYTHLQIGIRIGMCRDTRVGMCAEVCGDVHVDTHMRTDMRTRGTCVGQCRCPR